jgi:hypothetical protein
MYVRQNKLFSQLFKINTGSPLKPNQRSQILFMKCFKDFKSKPEGQRHTCHLLEQYCSDVVITTKLELQLKKRG